MPVHTVKQNFVLFFMFRKTAATFSTKFPCLYPEENGKPFCLCPEVNNARVVTKGYGLEAGFQDALQFLRSSKRKKINK
jgi:hypothetical protein